MGGRWQEEKCIKMKKECHRRVSMFNCEINLSFKETAKTLSDCRCEWKTEPMHCLVSLSFRCRYAGCSHGCVFTFLSCDSSYIAARQLLFTYICVHMHMSTTLAPIILFLTTAAHEKGEEEREKINSKVSLQLDKGRANICPCFCISLSFIANFELFHRFRQDCLLVAHACRR